MDAKSRVWGSRPIACHGRWGLLLGVLILSVTTCGGPEANMQWRSLRGPRASFVITLAADPKNEQVLYAGMLGGGLLISTDDGQNWQLIDDQPAPHDLVADWDEPDYALDVRSIVAEPDGRVYTASPGVGVYRRTGKNQWEDVNRGLPSKDTNVVTLGGSEDQVLYLGSMNGVYSRMLPTEPNDHWQRLDPWAGTPSERIQVLHASRDPTPRLYVGTQAGFFSSEDGGETWLPAAQGLVAKDAVIALAVNPNNPDHLVVSTYADRGIHVSTDGGQTWKASDQAFPSVVEDLVFSAAEPDRLYAATYAGTLHASLDGGFTWQMEEGPGFPIVSLLETGSGRLLVGTDGQDIWFRDPGDAWQRAYVSSSLLTTVSLLRHRDALYGGTSCCGVFRYTEADGWQIWNEGLPLQARLVTALAVDVQTDRLFAATHGDGVYLRASDATEWEPAGQGLLNQAGEVHSLQYVREDAGGVLLAGTTAGLYALQNEKWEYLDPPQIDIQYVPGNQQLFARTMQGQVWESSDGGASWKIDEHAPHEVVQLAYATKNAQDWTLFALTQGSGLYYRTPEESWQQADMASTPDGELSIWSYPGLTNGYLRVHVDAADSASVPLSNVSFEWQGPAEQAALDSLQAGIMVVAAAPENQTIYAGTANKGVYDAQVQFSSVLTQQPWFYALGFTLLVGIVVLAAYATIGRSRRSRERKKVPHAPAHAGPPIAIIRELLTDAFTAQDLKRFCQDRPSLKKAVDQFGPGHGLDDMVGEVIDYCEKNRLWDDLLAGVEQARPNQYALYESRLYCQVSPE